MSLYGALNSGVSGLQAQSSAMGAISDNISNVNTVGYKGTDVAFSTLVTKQTSSHMYSAGGVQAKPTKGIDVQGLLSSTSISTDLGISGQGYFVVNEAPNPGNGDQWAYTRAGQFTVDNTGYLKNTSNMYIQGWALMPYDGTAGVETVKIDGVTYMKAYSNSNAETVYINDNIIDSQNLQPINVNQIGGSATPTQQINMGANLPADLEVGKSKDMSVLIYDSLGNASNIGFTYTKTSSNNWDVETSIPPGAAVNIQYSNSETIVDGEPDVYSAIGQLEFTKLPQNHSYIKMTDGADTNATTYVYEFTTDGTTSYVPQPGEKVVAVDISKSITINDALNSFNDEIEKTMSSAARFEVDKNRIVIKQSAAGEEVTIDASKSLEARQSATNPDPNTGIPSGTFKIPAIDDEIKNAAKINFDSTTAADYIGDTIVINNNIYEFTNGGPATVAGAIPVDVSSAISGANVNPNEVTNLFYAELVQTSQDPQRFQLSGKTIEINQSPNGSDVLINNGNTETLRFTSNTQADYDGETIVIDGQTFTLTSTPALPVDPNEVDISAVDWTSATAQEQVMAALKGTIDNHPVITDSSRFQVKGDTMITGDTLIGAISMGAGFTNNQGITGVGANVISGRGKSDGAVTMSDINGMLVLGDTFTFNGTPDAQVGSKIPGIQFNADGTPKNINVDNMSIIWANGAQNMDSSPNAGEVIKLDFGSSGNADGFTQLSGDFSVNFIKQDGAQFGNYTGVTIGANGVVTALFDNGERKPISIIPLATFANPNGMEAQSGNSFIATDEFGAPQLNTAGTNGAGSINSGTLEQSTVDLGEEFTSMITTQRAYSASARIITTADEMLEELVRLK